MHARRARTLRRLQRADDGPAHALRAPRPARADDHVRGDRRRPLVLFYADFTCPRCAVAAERLKRRRVRACFRHFALRARHPRAVPLAHAVEAAARQGAFWELHDASTPTRAASTTRTCGRVRELGLDLDRFEADRRGPEVAERVARGRALGAAPAATARRLFVGGARTAADPPGCSRYHGGEFGLRDGTDAGPRRPTGGPRKEGPFHMSNEP